MTTKTLFMFAAILVASSTLVTAGSKDSRFDIYWIDVEGGAATLMVSPLGESVLIDTGNPGRRDPDRIVQVATKVANLRRIDHLIVTHYHRDHYGGASTLATMLPIVNMYDNGVFDEMPENPGKAYFDLKCEKRHVINPGDVVSLEQSKVKHIPLELRCLASRKQFIDPENVGAKENEGIKEHHKPKDRDGSDNANSVVMLLKFGSFEFFDGGDLTWNQEFNLVYPKNLVGEVDVYQVTHHGLDSSNNPVVLRSVEPRVAIMNNGVTKGCMPDVVANLKDTKSLEAIYQVHKNLREDGETNNVADEFIANHERDCKGHYIKLSVDPKGKTYTVSIPAHGHERTYETK